MNICIIDCETTGKIIDPRLPFTEVDNFPRVIQLGFLIADTDTEKTIYSRSHLIKPAGWTIPEETFWIMHGFSTEKSLAEGSDILPVLQDFVDSLEDHSVALIVAHNLSFDHSVLCAELYRHGLKSNRRPEKLCTMQVGTDVCKIPFGRDHRPWMNKSWKFPKLLELYQHLFGKGFEGGHDALQDCRAVRDCFFELLKRGVIKLPETVKNYEPNKIN